MTFEEFFKKKRIDLTALELGEPALFSEFKTHFEQMGEKSFDHTKKYWFNKLRRRFVLAPEVKSEKAHIANPLAEQTITESLIETVSAPQPKLGFVPKFRAGNVPKPAEVADVKTEESISPPVTETAPTEPAKEENKSAYQPRFKMKPKVETEEIPKEAPVAEPATPAIKDGPKPAYQPRFKMKPKEQPEHASQETPAIAPEPEVEEKPQPKPAYQPRFKMKPKEDKE